MARILAVSLLSVLLSQGKDKFKGARSVMDRMLFIVGVRDVQEFHRFFCFPSSSDVSFKAGPANYILISPPQKKCGDSLEISITPLETFHCTYQRKKSWVSAKNTSDVDSLQVFTSDEISAVASLSGAAHP